MEYKEFERIMSKKRMGRYFEACGGDTPSPPFIPPFFCYYIYF